MMTTGIAVMFIRIWIPRNVYHATAITKQCRGHRMLEKLKGQITANLQSDSPRQGGILLEMV